MRACYPRLKKNQGSVINFASGSGLRRVVGILAKQYGTEVAVRARRGVVLATGRFAYNDDMVAAHAPALVGRPAASVQEHDGASIRMAQALGADLAHLDATEVMIRCDPQPMARGIPR